MDLLHFEIERGVIYYREMIENGKNSGFIFSIDWVEKTYKIVIWKHRTSLRIFVADVGGSQ
jgi:hypothetical protein